MNRAQAIKRVFNNVTNSNKIHESILMVENLKGDFSIKCGYGGKGVDSPFLMASITKLFTTACILILENQKKIALNDKLTDYLDSHILNNLHIFNGEEYSLKLTVSDLLFQTSGLPDWFEEGGIKRLAVQEDFSITFEEIITKTKNMNPHFSPIGVKKAYYSDINFDLLGKIIEEILQIPLVDAYHNLICEPLGLKNTYLTTNSSEVIPNVFYKNESLYRPNLIASCYASGGGVTTTKELMVFLKAFFNGDLFPQSIFKELSVYKKLQLSMGPVYYGGGYMQIPMNTINTLFMGKGELLGHLGTTGSFAFYYPHKDLYFVGDLNQMKNPSLPIKLIMRLAIAIK
jgi:Beta-lactamase class C and other penicillin binding proteins